MPKNVPTPERTVNINGIEFGIYHYTGRDDNGNITQRGFIVCPVEEVNAGIIGFSDPEQSSRIGFSSPRDSKVAIASGAADTSPLDEETRSKAIETMRRLQERLNALSEMIETRRVMPNQLVETDYDIAHSTRLTAHSAHMPSGDLLGKLTREAEKVAKEWHTYQPPEIPDFEDVPTSHAIRVAKSSSESRMLDTVGDILMQHFPGDQQAEARSKATAAIVRTLNQGRSFNP